MSQGFSFKFDELQDGNPTEKEAGEMESQSYMDAGHIRNICFVWPDGRKKFLNYAYLVSGEYLSNLSTITLVFTSETVVIKGSGLGILFAELMLHLPKFVVWSEERYRQTDPNRKFNVDEIIFVKEEK